MMQALANGARKTLANETQTADQGDFLHGDERKHWRAGVVDAYRSLLSIDKEIERKIAERAIIRRQIDERIEKYRKAVGDDALTTTHSVVLDSQKTVSVMTYSQASKPDLAFESIHFFSSTNLETGSALYVNGLRVVPPRYGT